MAESLEQGAFRKVSRRLLPMAMLLFFMSLLELVNCDAPLDGLAIPF